MTKKDGRSEEKTDWLGNPYTQHTTEEGSKSGRSEEKTDWFGDNYTQHTTEDDNKSSRSEENTEMSSVTSRYHYVTNHTDHIGGSGTNEINGSATILYIVAVPLAVSYISLWITDWLLDHKPYDGIFETLLVMLAGLFFLVLAIPAIIINAVISALF